MDPETLLWWCVGEGGSRSTRVLTFFCGSRGIAVRGHCCWGVGGVGGIAVVVAGVGGIAVVVWGGGGASISLGPQIYASINIFPRYGRPWDEARGP